MKQIIALIILCVISASSSAATRFQVAGEGEIILSKDGQSVEISNTREGVSIDFIHVFEQAENGAKVAIFANTKNKNDLLVITLHDNDHQFVTFTRYNGEQLVGRWKIDATRYMSFTE